MHLRGKGFTCDSPKKHFHLLECSKNHEKIRCRLLEELNGE